MARATVAVGGPAAGAFLVGFATLALETLAPRLVARHLGTTVPVWTAAIASTLGGLALGNALGGALSDRGRPSRVTGVLLLAAGACVLAAPALDRVLERALASLSLSTRAPLHLAGLLLPACICLGAAATAIARWALAAGAPRGRTLGLVSAAGSAGSVVGVAVAGHVLVPWLLTSSGLAVVTACLAAAGAWLVVRRAPAVPSVERPATAATDSCPLAWAASTAFVAGAATLVVEVLAARIAARTAGSGLLTWTGVLLVTLASLSVGGAVGGRLADRLPPREGARRCLLWAGSLLAIAAWTSQGAPAWSPSAFPLAVRIVFRNAFAWGGPLVLLGALSVVATRAAAAGERRLGRRVGAAYAAGTVGALAGALATAPLLVPALGAIGAVFACAGTLGLVAASLASRAAWALVAGAAALLGVAVAPLPFAREAGRLFGLREDGPGVLVRESPYGRLKAEPAPPARAFGRAARRIVIDDAVHGLVDPGDPLWTGIAYVGTYAAVTDRVVPRGRPVRALCLGGGAYAVPRRVLASRPGSSVDVVEIDAEVTRLAVDALALDPGAPGLRIAHEDARTFLRDLPPDAPRYDVVYGDAFDDLAVPFHLTTVEAASAVSAALADEGVYLLNVIDLRDAPRFTEAVRTTLLEVFPFVAVLEDEAPLAGRAANRVLVASRRPVDLDGLERPDPSLHADAPGLRVVLRPRAGPGQVLTDDHAPVERLLVPVATARAGD